MSAVELAEMFGDALEAGDFDTVVSMLGDNFQVTGGAAGRAVGAQEWLGLSRALLVAAPDLSYNFKVLGGDENTAQVSTRFSGTHTGDLDLTGMGLGMIPATGVAFSAGEQFSEGRVENGKLVSLHLEAGPDNGLMDMLRQIGVELPGM